MIGLPVLNWKSEMHFSFILVKVTYTCDDSSVIDADYNMVCLMFVDICDYCRNGKNCSM